MIYVSRYKVVELNCIKMNLQNEASNADILSEHCRCLRSGKLEIDSSKRYIKKGADDLKVQLTIVLGISVSLGEDFSLNMLNVTKPNI